jgi:glycosyltransferase involved in cell wall biosynthesis
MKNVLIINQSSELYGSDKALLELIEHYPKGFRPIVVLEHEGPLKDILMAKGIQVIKCPVIKLNSRFLSFSGIKNLVVDTVRGLYVLRREIKPIPIDLIHSNSISVFLGAFYALLFRKKHVWHVHEIVESPRLIAQCYPRFVSFFSTRIIFNSQSSFGQFYKIKPAVKKKSIIIYNGQHRDYPATGHQEIKKIRAEIFRMSPNSTAIGLVGRISKRKGQMLLVEVFDTLLKKYPNIHLVFVGSPPPGQDFFQQQLEECIRDKGIAQKVTIVGFQENIWPVYDALDITVVPSIESESFGLVATEAMLSKKPVIASNYGGLSEIVVHQQTGLLVPPGNSQELESALESLLLNPDLAREMGEKGYERVLKEFSTSAYVNAITSEYKSITDPRQ